MRREQQAKHRDRHRQEQTQTHRHRHTDRHRQTQTHRQTHTQTQTDTHTHTSSHELTLYWTKRIIFVFSILNPTALPQATTATNKTVKQDSEVREENGQSQLGLFFKTSLTRLHPPTFPFGNTCKAKQSKAKQSKCAKLFFWLKAIATFTQQPTPATHKQNLPSHKTIIVGKHQAHLQRNQASRSKGKTKAKHRRGRRKQGSSRTRKEEGQEAQHP